MPKETTESVDLAAAIRAKVADERRAIGEQDAYNPDAADHRRGMCDLADTLLAWIELRLQGNQDATDDAQAEYLLGALATAWGVGNENPVD